MPQVYIRDDVYHGIIEIGIKSRKDIRDYVNDTVSQATNQKRTEESEHE